MECDATVSPQGATEGEADRIHDMNMNHSADEIISVVYLIKDSNIIIVFILLRRNFASSKSQH